MIESVKGLGPYLKLDLFGDGKFALQGEIESLPSWAINCISSYVTESESSRCGKRSRVEPLICRSSAWSKDRLARIVRANRVFTKQCPCICGVAEDGDGKREAALRLVDRRELPVSRERICNARLPQRR